jgi:GTP-binding protein EngB required for normal cell division
MGRMCTLMKKQHASLAYLEQVRQHLSRLPSIDPNTRTLLLTGFPNVGKSSFINKVTRADVEVQPFEFTTKSLFVGHMDYKYLRWQVIDTPGLLDHPLEDRNTIEMQSVTALAHLRAAIVFIVDISEQCGHSIAEQVSLFDSVRPLFANKPVVIALNKIDLIEPSALSAADIDLLKRTANSCNATIEAMSTYSEAGLAKVKRAACDALLEQRVEAKLNTRRVTDLHNRLHAAMPVPRDQKKRDVYVPPGVQAARRRVLRRRRQAVDADDGMVRRKDADGAGLLPPVDADVQAALAAVGVVPPGPGARSGIKGAGDDDDSGSDDSGGDGPSPSSSRARSIDDDDDDAHLTATGKRRTALRGALRHYDEGSMPVHLINWVEQPYREGEDPSNFSVDWRKDYDLDDPEWRFDPIPEIHEGHNVYDFIDPEIEQRLDELEAEEEARVAELENAMDSDDDDKYELDDDEKALLRKIRRKKRLQAKQKQVDRPQNGPVMPRTFGLRKPSLKHLREHMTDMGLDGAKVGRGGSAIRQTIVREERGRERARARNARDFASVDFDGLSGDDGNERVSDDGGNDDDENGSDHERRLRSRSRSAIAKAGNKRARSRSSSRGPGSERRQTGMSSDAQKDQAEKRRRTAQRKGNKAGRAGESDRAIHEKLPKHLYSGKRGMGKTDRR